VLSFNEPPCCAISCVHVPQLVVVPNCTPYSYLSDDSMKADISDIYSVAECMGLMGVPLGPVYSF